MSLYDAAFSVAVEHVLYWRRCGVNIRQLMHSIGKKPVDSWDECVETFAFMWVALSPTKRTTTTGLVTVKTRTKRRVINAKLQSGRQLVRSNRTYP